MDLHPLLRAIPDFPKAGIIFRDITPILADPKAFHYVTDWFCDTFKNEGVIKVCAAEARGFMLAAAIGYKMDWGIVPIRKPGKLPWKTIHEEYDLEYGTAILHMHEDAIAKGERILVVDDLLATGGTAEAMIKLVERAGGVVAGAGFLVELDDLHGRKMLGKHRVESLMHIAGA